MGKDTYLINIYLKIHHKQELSMDDLKYLAEYDPECFEKTCRNVVYNIPEAKHIIIEETKGETENSEICGETSRGEDNREYKIEKKPFRQASIEKILDNIKKMEINDFPRANIDVDRVKSLLGNLYMELLFPHNDKDTFFNTMPEAGKSVFDKKA